MAVSFKPYSVEQDTMANQFDSAQEIEKNILKNGLEDAEFIATYMSEAAFEKSKVLSGVGGAGSLEVHHALEELNVANRLAYQALNVYRVLRLANDKARGFA
jgi:hypothetical protein